MDETAVSQFITTNFAHVQTVTVDGNTFFFYDPEQKFPFVTLVTNDAYEQVSNLERPGVFRLNIGVSKQTYQSLFGEQSEADESDLANYDFSALNTLMPHPVYSRQHWISILNPSKDTFQSIVQPLLSEAYERDMRKHAKRNPVREQA